MIESLSHRITPIAMATALLALRTVTRKMNASPHQIFTILFFCLVHRGYVLACACVVRRYCVRLCCVAWSTETRSVYAVISIAISTM